VPGVVIDAEFDLGNVVNEDSQLGREYDGLHTAIQYRFNDRLQIGATYSLSRAYGNFDGETGGGGPSTSGILSYPEYNTATSYADGDLAIDQRHKFRGWLVWDFLSTSKWNVGVSWLENFWTGSPYGAASLVIVGANFWIDNPGYLSPPTWGSYTWENRDTYRTDNIHRTDLALNISFFAGKNFEIYLQPEVLNVFNENGVVDVNNTTYSWREDRSLEYFDPFTNTPTPVEGTHWYKDDRFGQPETEGDYQLPRIFRVSVGFRF